MQKDISPFLFFWLFFAFRLPFYFFCAVKERGSHTSTTSEQSLFTTSKGSFRDLWRFLICQTLEVSPENLFRSIPDVARAAWSRELYVNAYWESNMVLLMKRSTKVFCFQIEDAQGKSNLRILNIWAIAEIRPDDVASPGWWARGFGNSWKSTAKNMAGSPANNVDEPLSPRKNLPIALLFIYKKHTKNSAIRQQ